MNLGCLQNFSFANVTTPFPRDLFHMSAKLNYNWVPKVMKTWKYWKICFMKMNKNGFFEGNLYEIA